MYEMRQTCLTLRHAYTLSKPGSYVKRTGRPVVVAHNARGASASRLHVAVDLLHSSNRFDRLVIEADHPFDFTCRRAALR